MFSPQVNLYKQIAITLCESCLTAERGHGEEMAQQRERRGPKATSEKRTDK